MSQVQIYFSEIAAWYTKRNGTVLNFGLAEDHIISFPRAIDICDASNITMLTKKYKESAARIVEQTAGKLIIIPQEILALVDAKDGKAFLIHDNPKEVLIDFCKAFLAFEAPNAQANIHPTAQIEKGAVIGENNIIGANVFISENTVIGNNNTIGSNTVLKNATVGNNVIIGSNTTIGENGFGYNKLENGEIELFPHYGRVIINDNVHIGNNTCIDRGSLSDTTISAGVKIDNLVHIAHNVQIGENSLIIACSMIAGSVVIGSNCWVAPSSAVRNAISIGKNTTIGIGSTVTKSVDDDQTVLGSPAMPLGDFMKLRKEEKKWLLSHNDQNSEK